MVEVVSTIVLMFWVSLEKNGPRYSHCTSDSVYTDLSLNTLYLSLVSKSYNFSHAVYIYVYLIHCCSIKLTKKCFCNRNTKRKRSYILLPFIHSSAIP